MSNPHIKYIDAGQIDMLGQTTLDFCGITTVGWYFWDETGAFAHGPYETEAIAEKELNAYGTNLTAHLGDTTVKPLKYIFVVLFMLAVPTTELLASAWLKANDIPWNTQTYILLAIVGLWMVIGYTFGGMLDESEGIKD